MKIKDFIKDKGLRESSLLPKPSLTSKTRTMYTTYGLQKTVRMLSLQNDVYKNEIVQPSAHSFFKE
jgi:hypothetical protein